MGWLVALAVLVIFGLVCIAVLIWYTETEDHIPTPRVRRR